MKKNAIEIKGSGLSIEDVVSVARNSTTIFIGNKVMKNIKKIDYFLY